MFAPTEPGLRPRRELLQRGRGLLEVGQGLAEALQALQDPERDARIGSVGMIDTEKLRQRGRGRACKLEGFLEAIRVRCGRRGIDHRGGFVPLLLGVVAHG